MRKELPNLREQNQNTLRLVVAKNAKKVLQKVIPDYAKWYKKSVRQNLAVLAVDIGWRGV
ncbi:hypothetical protein MIDIC_120003 [Alphaproteobacteria bacterium]